MGLYFTTAKQEAILRGDISNTVVDRHFVYGFQAIGVHFRGVPKATPAMIRLQARYLQLTLESLFRLNETKQERAKAQALMLAIHAAVITGFTALAQYYLVKACKIIEKANFQFLPEHGPPAELSEPVREELSTLCQAIYLENHFYLVLGGAGPVMTARIEREFRSELQVRAI